eukprot:CAMPEP_0118676050 /NCGR_PEP_ID=MMETSP0800-20121206/1814_1 /TAXON_ID=210618 ORGANISM="Striatella unipunctata, Strain CCMP2910" /NCGR_SAMPLE_ID=MMETSP0800 /ASSEMBLY_ACC=CAM_ASM_000638 /LENGTH=331 /DNA_ID=CAMNT_0006571485 /DNA_START=15 /DNA_END=1010 /DNA_ORIENTATION=-
MASKRTPMLGLRMKDETACLPSPTNASAYADQLVVMLHQEQNVYRSDVLHQEQTVYRSDDYIQRRKQEKICSSRQTPTLSELEVDSACREKMCEWSYRVIDHFHANREIVAIAFSYLDRFVDRCKCDRSAFKLASMTSLYLATKIFNLREISMGSLAELSRGEFDMSHIEEMEGIIIQALEWRLHPPTVQDFIGIFFSLLPPVSAPAMKIIYQRARFFAEIALFDHSFISKRRSVIAYAATMNALEGLDDTDLSVDLQVRFLRNLKGVGMPDLGSSEVHRVRDKLWYIYSRSEQCQKLDLLPASPQKTHQTHEIERRDDYASKSPICVSTI